MNRFPCRSLRNGLLMTSLLIFASINSLPAQSTYNWITGSNTWQNASSWSPGGPPGSIDTARFNSATSSTDVLEWDAASGNRTIGQLHFFQGDYEINNVDLSSQYELTIGSSATNAFQIGGSSNPELRLNGMYLNVTNSSGLIGAGASLSLDVSADVSGIGESSRVSLSGILANTGTLNVRNGSTFSNTTGYLGFPSDSTGTTTIDGAGSQWINSGNLRVGYSGTGIVNVTQGGHLSNDGNAFIGDISSSTNSMVTVTDSGSTWNSAGHVRVGNSGSGTLNVSNGGVVSNSYAYIGTNASSTGTATVAGIGSTWNSSGNLWVGGNSTASGGAGALNIDDGGLVSVGGRTTLWSTGTVNLDGGTLRTHSFDNTQNGQFNFRDGTLEVTGAGGTFNPGTTDFFIDGSTPSDHATLIISDQASTTLDSFLAVGWHNQGSLRVENGGEVSSRLGYLGVDSSSEGTATVTGSGSRWVAHEWLEVGHNGRGILNVENGGEVSAIDFAVGFNSNGTMNVQSKGIVSNTTGMLGLNSGSTGTATVTGAGSQWNSSGNLFVGGKSSGIGGEATLNIENEGLVSVGGTTRIYSTGTVNLNGGRFEFGQTSLDDFASINAVSGSMAGNIDHSGFTDLATLTSFQNNDVDLTDVTLTNSGTLHGMATNLGISLVNTSSGELFTTASDFVRFVGSGVNSGEINNVGGTVRFEQTVTNQSGGFIGGRGNFAANGGWTNSGVMAFSGDTDLFGDVENLAGGQIVTSGGATTTFYDDLIHNGTEIRTAAGSNSVFFGGVSGAGPFNGTGTVYFEGDLRPGNSPDIVLFEGDVVLGTGAQIFIDIAGIMDGEFDQFLIDGDLSLDGGLQVELLDSFVLGFDQQFLIADVGGSLFGQFDGFGEGGLVGNYGGRDLFISYSAGDGNDVALFTSVPEPNSCVLFVFGVVGFLRFRRRRPVHINRA